MLEFPNNFPFSLLLYKREGAIFSRVPHMPAAVTAQLHLTIDQTEAQLTLGGLVWFSADYALLQLLLFLLLLIG